MSGGPEVKSWGSWSPMLGDPAQVGAATFDHLSDARADGERQHAGEAAGKPELVGDWQLDGHNHEAVLGCQS